MLQPYASNVDWDKYPWQNAILHFARLLGSVHNDQLDNARQELKNLNVFRDSLLAQKRCLQGQPGGDTDQIIGSLDIVESGKEKGSGTTDVASRGNGR